MIDSQDDRQGALPYQGEPPHRKHSARRQTSDEAAQSVKPKASSMRDRLYAWGDRRGRAGWTDDELIAQSGMDYNSIGPRRRELVGEGRVGWTGNTRKSRKDRDQMVWITKRVSEEYGIPFVPIEQGTEAKLRARIAELERQVANLEAAAGGWR